jgi:two-component system CheB/CheR fusion protein
LITDAIDNMATRDREVRDRTGRLYSLRVRPYKNQENQIDGAVLALIDVEEARRYHKDAEAADKRASAAAERRDYAEAVIETVREPLLVLDADQNVRTINRAFRDAFNVRGEDVEGQPLAHTIDGQFNTPQVRKLLDHVLEKDSVEDFLVEQDFKHIGRRRLAINARRVPDHTGRPGLILLAIADVTAK